MLLQKAQVVAVEPDLVWVRVLPESVCDRCQSATGCGLSILATWRGQRHLPLAPVAEKPLMVGDQVMIGVDEGSFLRAVVDTLLIPLMAMMLLALSVELLLDAPELFTILAAFMGLLGGFYWVRHSCAFVAAQQAQPRLLGCLSTADDDSSRFSS